MIRKYYILLFFYLASLNVVAQYTNSMWYFAKQRLNFSTNIPTFEPTTIQAGGAQFVVTDCEGKLKMVAVGGSYIYNRDEKIMKGSQFLESASYSLINGFAYPGSKDSIVIFHDILTQSPYRHFWGYSIVDLSKDSGRGEVVVSNIIVRKRPNPNLAIVQHKNGIDFWVLGTNDSVNAFAYKFTFSGLDTVPVTSTGVFNNYLDSKNDLDYTKTGLCYAPFMPTWDNKQIIVTGLTKWRHSSAMALIYDFDNNTGKITNAQILFKRTEVVHSNYTAQKAAISFNDTFVYFGVIHPNHGGLGDVAYFFQINRFTKKKTLLRMQYISKTFTTYGFWGTTLGPDGKILVRDFSNTTLSQPLGNFWRVEKPNEAGINCLYRNWRLDSSGGIYWTLPTTILKSTPPYFVVNSNSNSCLDTTVVAINGDTALYKLVLRFGDGDTLLFTGPFNYGLKFKHYYKVNGNYSLEMITWDKYCNMPKWFTDTITVYKPPQIFTTQLVHKPTCTGDTVKVTIKAQKHSRFTANWGYPKPGGGFYDTVLNTSADSTVFQFFYPETTNKFNVVFSVSNNLCGLNFSDSVNVISNPKPNNQYYTSADSTCGDHLLTVTDSGSIWRQTYMSWPNSLDTLVGTGVLSLNKIVPNSISVRTDEIHFKTINAEGCTKADTLFIHVYPRPEGSISSLDTVICAQQQAAIAVGKRMVNPDNASWNVNDAFETKNDSVWNMTYTDAGDYTIWFTSITDKGCTDTSSVVFHVLGLPKAGFNSNYDTLCSKRALLDINSTATSLYDSIVNTWYSTGKGDTLFGTTANNISYPKQGNYMLKQYVGTSQGCFDTAIRAIAVIESPDASFHVLDDKVCSGQSILAVSDNTKPSNFGNWYFPVLGIKEPISWSFGAPRIELKSNQTATLKGSYNIVYVLYNFNECTDTVIHSVRVYTKPTADFSIPSICEGQNAIFTSNGSPGEAPIVVYMWKDPINGNIQQGSTGSYIFNSAGTYSLTHILVDTNGCSDTISKSVTVKFSPKPSIIWNPFKLQDAPPFKYYFQAEPKGMQQYVWTFEEAGVMNGIEVFPAFSGNKDSLKAELKVTSPNGCIVDTSIYFRIFGVTGFYFPNAITMNDDGLNEDFGISGPEHIKSYTLMIFNKWGEKVFETHDPHQLWKPEKPLPGIYVYHCKMHDVYNRTKEMKGTFILLR